MPASKSLIKSFLSIATTIALFACGGASTDWQAEYIADGHTYAEGHSVALNAQGSVITTGISTPVSGSSQGSLFVNAYSKEGNVEWQTLWDDDTYFGTAAKAAGDKIVLDSNGNSYVAGIATLGSIFNKRLVLLKLNASGEIQWVKSWEGRYGKVHLITGNNKLFIGAYKDSDSGPVDFLTLKALDFDGTELWSDELDYYVVHISDLDYQSGRLVATATLNQQGLVAAWNEDGQRLWQAEIGTSHQRTKYSASVMDTSLNVYIVGHEAKDPEDYESNDDDLVIRKLDPLGNELWSQTLSATSTSVEISKGIGLFENSVIVGASTAKGATGAVNIDGLVAAFDTNTGTLKWSKQHNSSGVLTLDTAWDFEVDASGTSSLLVNTMTVLPPTIAINVFSRPLKSPFRLQ